MSEPKSVGAMIKELRKAKGLSQAELADRMGYKDRTTITKLESGFNELPNTKTGKMAGLLGVSVDYLLNTFERNLYCLDVDFEYLPYVTRLHNTETGVVVEYSNEDWKNIKESADYRRVYTDLGPPFVVADPNLNVVSQLPSGLEPMPTTNKVPRLGQIACGTPILAEENIQGYDDIPSWIKCDFTLTCKGDSMINARIFDGDVVCIHKQPEVENGEIAAVMVDDDTATLKRVRKFEDHIILEPENPNYRPQTFWDADMARVRILGKATHFVSTIR